MGAGFPGVGIGGLNGLQTRKQQIQPPVTDCEQCWNVARPGAERVCLENATVVHLPTGASTHSFTWQIFIKILLCVKRYPGGWYEMVNKTNIISDLRKLTPNQKDKENKYAKTSK